MKLRGSNDNEACGRLRSKVLRGDCRALMKTLADNSVDSIVCDPPYELGFMGKEWDSSGIAYDAEGWSEALRVLKPGGHLIAFSGSRTYHRLAIAIEDAGFQIRDQMMWLYGTGFPKSHNIGKAIDKTLGKKRKVVGTHERLGFNKLQEQHGVQTVNVTHFTRTSDEAVTPQASKWQGWGTALKPAHEPIVLARKPLSEKSVAANVLRWTTGSINIDGCRVPLPANDHLRAGLVRNGHSLDTACREGSWGFKAVDRAAGLGRFPANVIHDGSEEISKQFADTRKDRKIRKHRINGSRVQETASALPSNDDDSVSAARYFYAAKASSRDRDEGLEEFAQSVQPFLQTANGMSGKASPMGGEKNATLKRANCHPTVKPNDLMRYLCRLITPPHGVILDPFMGSGSTGKAAVQEGFRFVGIERDPTYFEIACARIAHAEGLPWKGLM